MRFLREMLRPFSFRRPVGGTLQMTKARNAGEARRLADIPNIGPAMVADFRNLGIEQPGQLAGKDPYDLSERLCPVTGVRHDPCLLQSEARRVGKACVRTVRTRWA